MNIKFWLNICVVFFAYSSICYCRKNVLLLIADDMRPQLGAYRGKYYPAPVTPKMHTPNLDALAARSLLLERAYVQQALCAPSRASLLTGRRPDTTHVYRIGPYFRKVGGNFTTIPQYFKNNGYISIGMGKVFHIPRLNPGEDYPLSWSQPFFYETESDSHYSRNSWAAIPDDLLIDNSLRDERIAIQAIKTLQKLAPAARSGNQPFFLAAGFHKPHLPFVFPKSFLDYYPSVKQPDNPYAPVDMPQVAWFKYTTFRKRFDDIKALNVSGEMNTTLPDQTTLQLRRAYYSAVTWIDSLIGRVLGELDKLGLSNNTVVSFIGDHGYQLGEHGEWCKQTNFDLATHAPMMIRIPGQTDKGVKTNQLVEFVDLFPTLVEAAGFEPIPQCSNHSTATTLCHEGASLMPLITLPNRPIKYAAFSQCPRKFKSNFNAMGYSIRTERYRYTEWANFTYEPEYKPDWRQLAGIELYDHQNDPYENINRAHDRHFVQIKKQLSTLLHKGWVHAKANLKGHYYYRKLRKHDGGLLEISTTQSTTYGETLRYSNVTAMVIYISTSILVFILTILICYKRRVRM